MKKIYNLQNIDFLEIEKSLKTGELIIYPTDTVYGIGGVISSEETIKNIYKAKERSFKSPLIVLVSDVKKIEEVAYIEEKNREAIEKLIAKFWPGGLTIILKKKSRKEPAMPHASPGYRTPHSARSASAARSTSATRWGSSTRRPPRAGSMMTTGTPCFAATSMQRRASTTGSSQSR